MYALSGPDSVMVINCVIAGVLGTVMNGVLMYLIAVNKDLRRKDYVCFILTRALADLVYSIHLTTIQPAAILLSEPTSSLCIAAGFLELAFALSSIYSEPMLACNRYISIFHSGVYKRVYSNRNVYLICITVWVFATITNVPHIIFGTLGRSAGSFCSARFASDTMVVVLLSNYSFMFVGLGSIIFFNFKMFFFLNKHQNQPMTNSQRTKLQSDREMLRFIFMAAFFPLIFQLPLMVVLWLNMVISISAWLVCIFLSIFMISFVLNPVITLLMVRPIRNQLVTKIKRFLGRHASTVQVEPTGQISQFGQVTGNVLIRVEQLRRTRDHGSESGTRRRMSVPMGL